MVLDLTKYLAHLFVLISPGLRFQAFQNSLKSSSDVAIMEPQPNLS